MPNKKNLLILASGDGTNAGAIVRHIQSGGFDINISAACNTNPENAGVYKRMEKFGLRAEHIPSDRDFHALRKLLDSAEWDLIALAGYMAILPGDIAVKHNIINIHPSVLPFVHKGSKDAYRDAVYNRDKIVGCTAHRVAAEVDAGERLAQIGFAVPLHLHDTYRDEALEYTRKIGLAHEWALYPRVVAAEIFGQNVLWLDMREIKAAAAESIRQYELPETKTITPDFGVLFGSWDRNGR
ncbi:MAG: hypothetical protein LBG89_00065 [Rickettsiales bacterium]|nr:hypothetical protein [Rickettsiales bacterium]